MAHSVVSSESICPAECLLFSTKIAVNLLLSRIVNRVLVASKIVGSREHSVARLASARVDPVTTMRSRLATNKARSHTHIVVRAGNSKALCLAVTLPLVLLEQRRSLKSEGAAMVRACVGTAVSASADWPPTVDRCAHARSHTRTARAQSGRGRVVCLGNERILLGNLEASRHVRAHVVHLMTGLRRIVHGLWHHCFGELINEVVTLSWEQGEVVALIVLLRKLEYGILRRDSLRGLWLITASHLLLKLGLLLDLVLLTYALR